jgi:hypothetical protein
MHDDENSIPLMPGRRNSTNMYGTSLVCNLPMRKHSLIAIAVVLQGVTGMLASSGFVRNHAHYPFFWTQQCHQRLSRHVEHIIPLRQGDDRVKSLYHSTDDDAGYSTSDSTTGEMGLSSTSVVGATSLKKTMELWLDLRGTALSPKDAISILSENVYSEYTTINEIIDRVIVSPETMDKIILKQQPQGIPVFFVPAQSVDLVVSDPIKQQSLPCGKLIRSTLGTLFNPIVALDIVMKNGGWVLLEHNPDTGEPSFLEEVNSLMSFLVGSSSSTLTLSFERLIPGGVEGTNKEEDSMIYSTIAGSGMAIACPSRNVLVDVSKSILALSSLPGGASTSPGGILLPTAMKNNHDGAADIIQVEDAENAKEGLTLAVVLPLDLKLWSTAMELVADPDDTLEDELLHR